MKMQLKNFENLKLELKDYNIDSFRNHSKIHMSYGQETDTSIIQRLMKTSVR